MGRDGRNDFAPPEYAHACTGALCALFLTCPSSTTPYKLRMRYATAALFAPLPPVQCPSPFACFAMAPTHGGYTAPLFLPLVSHRCASLDSSASVRAVAACVAADGRQREHVGTHFAIRHARTHTSVHSGMLLLLAVMCLCCLRSSCL